MSIPPDLQALSDEVMTPTEVGQMLQVHRKTVTRWILQGRLRGIRIGGQWRVLRRDLDGFLGTTEEGGRS